MGIFPLAMVEAGSYNYDHYYNNASMKQLRFHDFEPRQQQMARMADADTESAEQEETSTEAGRQARGFHFNALGDDVNVGAGMHCKMCSICIRERC